MGHQHRCFATLLSLVFEQVRRVSDRRARAHRGRDYRRFRQHRVICAGLTGCSYMQLNAVWALRSQRNGNRHQLLVQDINGTIFERLFVKSPKGFHRFRCILIELLEPSEIFHIKHVVTPFWVLVRRFRRSEVWGARLVIRLRASIVTPQNARERQNLIRRNRVCR